MQLEPGQKSDFDLTRNTADSEGPKLRRTSAGVISNSAAWLSAAPIQNTAVDPQLTTSCAGSGVVGIGPVCLLAGCHTRRLNQALSVLSFSLDFCSVVVKTFLGLETKTETWTK